jgi:uncharacterized linocin/CFP29 family protein
VNGSNNGINPAGWDEASWKDINDAIQGVVASIRVTTQVFPPQLLPNAQNVCDQRVDPTPPLTMSEGSTKSFIKVREEFVLTQNQVDTNSDTHVAQTLGMLIAATLAQVTDGIIFQGNNFSTPPGVTIERPPEDDGLFGIAASNVNVILKDGRGDLIYDAVVQGIAELNALGMATQQKQCALFLESSVFAQAQSALPNTMVTPASSIAPLVEGGFFSTSGLQPNTGLLVTLGGDPIDVAIRDEATATWLRQDGDGHHFDVYSSFQYVVKDPRALVQLEFQDPTAAK